MSYHHLRHAHKPREPIPAPFIPYTDHDTQFARAIAENSEPLLPRDAKSPDNYGLAPGEGPGSGSGSSGSSGSGSGTSSGGGAGASPPCNPAFDVTCQTNGNSTTTIPIVLGIVIPVSFFVVAMVVIWRIKKKRSRKEAAEDKHASLDFGLGEVSRTAQRNGRKKRKNGQPEMMDLSAEKQFRKDRGLSFGDSSSPYVMPGELNGSRSSFHSLSQSAYGQEDPYRPVALIRSESYDSRPGSRQDNHSIWTQSSDRTARGLKSPLVDNAQPPSRAPSVQPTGDTPLLGAMSPRFAPPAPPEEDPTSIPNVPRKPVGQPAGTPNTLSPLDPRNPPQAMIASTDSLVATDMKEDPQWDQPAMTLPAASANPLPTFSFTEEPPQAVGGSRPPPPPKRSSLRHPSPEHPRRESLPEFDDYTTYADVLGIVQKESGYADDERGLGVYGVDIDHNRLSASMRPLPPDDLFDNPEDRANRIRSFYKEYFDEKRGTMADPYGNVEYYEDYNQEYLDGATVWDPQSGQFVVAGGGDRPYAEPVTRRAMTPPPRAPPRFRNGSAGGRMYGSRQVPPGAGRPRGRSSAGAAIQGRRPEKKMPPPAPLNNLPTPYLLRDDSAIFNAGDFAPPKTWTDRLAGRPASPKMDKMPYSPTVRAFTPLASSFNELRAMPSPHALRRSGTFTGLDFAQPPRINSAAASDAGSVRSGRSTTSRMQVANIRAGAYRVSRLPHEFVGTKGDFATALRPSWDQRGPANGI